MHTSQFPLTICTAACICLTIFSPGVLPVCLRISVSPSQAWVNTPRNKGGLGGCSYPLLADLTKQVAKDYEVLIESGPDAGVALR
mgnify:CR=1 FL=1